jgi:hypothetical protein
MICLAITISSLLFGAIKSGDANRFSPAFIANNGHVIGGLSFEKRITHPSQSHSFIHTLHTRPTRHILSSTVEKGNNPSSTNRNPDDKVKYNVIYQKVLRARSKESAQMFLIQLISYLQSMYELPDGLAMPYDTEIPDEDNDVDGSSDNRAILVIDSSLADDISQARIEVEVIGIFPDSDDDKQAMLAGPSMAMVALKKIKSKNDTGNSVTSGLFADCEKRIIQSFDRGLQDFEEDRVSPSSLIDEDDNSQFNDEFNDLDDDGIDAAIKRMGYQNVIQAASADVDISSKDKNTSKVNEPKNPISIERDEMGNVIIDSKAAVTRKEKKEQATASKPKAKVPQKSLDTAAATASVQKPNSKLSETKFKWPVITNQASEKKFSDKQPIKDSSCGSESEDFAIRMARKQAEALMTTAKLGASTSLMDGTINISGGEGEFAVQAAKRAAAKKQNIKPISKNTSKGQEPTQSDTISTAQPKNREQKAQDLSKDAMFMKLQSIANETKQRSWSKTISKKGSRPLTKVASDAKPDLETLGASEDAQSGNMIDASDPSSEVLDQQKSDDEIRQDITDIARNNKQVQDLLQYATDMLPNDGEDGDLSPEELLARVLKVSIWYTSAYLYTKWRILESLTLTNPSSFPVALSKVRR